MRFRLEPCGVGKGQDSLVFLGEPGFVDKFGHAGNDARGVEIVVERLALAQKFGEEKQIEPLIAS